MTLSLESLRTFCETLPGSEEDLPFGEETLVFKVGGKIYALTDLESYEFINLKCDPEHAVELREEFEEVTPGYHMNKRHWNSVRVDGSLTAKQLKGWIVDSYQLVRASLTKKQQAALPPLA